MRLPDRQRSYAVLIGSGKYADDKLPNLPAVGKTLDDLTAALTDPIYGVVPKNHCTVLKNQGDIRLIGRNLRLAATQAEDLLLVYFVGHGLVDGRRHQLYLGLPDSEWAEPEFNSLEYDKLRSSVLDSPAATKIIILDCCFSGRVVSEAMADPVTEMVGQMEVDGTYVLASAERNQVALVLPGEDYTAFTGRLLDLLRNGVPGGPELLTIDYLYRQLAIKMKAEGLSQPQKRGTATADSLALAENRAFVPAPREDALDNGFLAGAGIAAVPRAEVRPEIKGYWHERRLASWGQRVPASLIDVVPLIPGFVVADVGNSHHWQAITVLGWIAAVLPWLYNRWYRQTRTGQSWGKSVMRLKLVDMSDQGTLLWWKAGLRDWAHYLDALALWIGFFVPLFDARRQTLADKALRTVVLSVGPVSPSRVPAAPRSSAVIEKSEPV
jgi:uncharacterized RDD family membrane protein YckC